MKALLLSFLCIFLRTETQATLQVGIHRIPNQPVRLYSGGSVLLTCTVTTTSPNTTVTVEWRKSLQSLQHVSNSIHISPLYRLQDHIWQSSLDLRVLTVHSSSWYHCIATTDDGRSIATAHYQINVEESGNQAIIQLTIPSVPLYAQVPFTVNSTLHLPAVISPQVRVEWYRNGIKENDNKLIRTFIINSTAIASVLQVREPFPVSGIIYTCVYIAERYGINIFSLNQSTTALSIASKPIPQVTLSTLPRNGPTPFRAYSVTCSAIKPVNGTLTLSWRKNGLPVKTIGNVQLGQPILTQNSTSLRMRFSNNIDPEDEGRYICTASLQMDDYDIVLTESASITILAPTRILSVQTRSIPSNLKWVAGSDVSLLCSVQANKEGSISIAWETDSGPVNTNARYYTKKLTKTLYESVLQLQSVLHSQLYYCVALIDGSLASEDWYYLNVLTSSNFSSNSVTLISPLAPPIIGNQYSLTCTSTRPNEQVMPLAVQWTRDNVILHSHYISSLLSNATHITSVLSFTSLQVTDGGTYLCSVIFKRVFGSTQNTQGSASIELKLKAPYPRVMALPSFNSKRITCLVEFEKAHHDITVGFDWLIVHNEKQFVVTGAEEFFNVMTSESNMADCGRVYSQYIDNAGDDTFSVYTDLLCQVTISGSGIISTVSRASLNNGTTAAMAPSQPQGISVTNIGSHWIQLNWEAHNPYSLKSFVIEYTEVGRGIAHSFDVNGSNDNKLHTTLLTNLLPATQYSVRIISKSIAGTNSSEILEFITNETAPSGPPLDLLFRQSGNNTYTFTWSSPDPDKMNGLITGYRFQCNNITRSLNELFYSATTIATNISVNGLLLDANYTCSLAAFNGAGIGPVTTIVFSTAGMEGITGTGVSEEDTGQLFPLTVYSLAPLTVLLLVGTVIITMLACYYKRKLKRHSYEISDGINFNTSLPTSTSRSRSTPSQSRQQQRYVSSDTIQQLCQGRQERLEEQDYVYLSPPTNAALKIIRVESTV